METILVTGGAGFIGSHCCETLLEGGYTVVCLDDLNDYYSPAQKEQNITQAKTNPNFHFVKGDIRDAELLDQLAKEYEFDGIIHLAARAGVRASLKDPLLYEDVNVKGTLLLLELARKLKARFVFGSSSSVYGNNEKLPFHEDDELASIVSPYAATKLAGEQFCKLYHDIHGLSVVCLRFFTVYGPRGRPDMAPYKFVDAIMNDKELTMFGDGSSTRDYTYVGDIVAGIIAAMESNIDFSIINLGNDTPIMLKDFIKAVEDAVGKKANIVQLPAQEGDAKATWADISRARSLLEYEPMAPIEEGIAELVEWYKK